MLVRSSQQSSTLFANSMNRIDIIIDEVSHKNPLTTANNIVSFHDKNDQCMKAIVDKFVMGDIARNPFERSGLQATFFLKDTSKIELNLITEVEIPNDSVDKEFILTGPQYHLFCINLKYN